MFNVMTLILCSLLWFGGLATARGASSEWLTDFDKAMEKAAKVELPMIVRFTCSDTSEACQTLNEEVFDHQRFRDWSEHAAVLVSVDLPEKRFQNSWNTSANEELKARFDVTEFPTVIVLRADGQEARRFGFETDTDAAAWTTRLMNAADAASPHGGWLRDLEEAKKRAKATRRPILANFTGSDWCPWCKKLQKEVFRTDEFRTWSREHVILLEVDFPRHSALPAKIQEQNAALRKAYDVRGYPAVLFLDPKGTLLGKKGYAKGGPQIWIDAAEAILE